MKPNPDVVDESVAGWNDEGLIHPRRGSPPCDRQSRQDRVAGAHLISGDGVLRWSRRIDDSVLGPASQAAPQVIARESVFDSLLDASAVRREGHRVAVVADQGVDIGLCGSYALNVGLGQMTRGRFAPAPDG